MATINWDILNAAASDGVFDRGREPNENQRLYYHDSLITAWSILSLIETNPQGIGCKELAELTGLARSTVVLYCQWLKQSTLVEFSSDFTRGTPHYHYPLDPSGLTGGPVKC